MQESIVHFSGGADSTLCAALEAEVYDRVHILTFERISFVGTQNKTIQNYQKLCDIYGEHKFVRKIISIEQFHKRVCYKNYFSLVRRFGLSVTALSFSKIAMYWASALYAKENKIFRVVDGSTEYMSLYPDQNKNIGSTNYREFFRSLGIEYDTPVYKLGDQVEQILYDKGITDHPIIRGTKSDQQVVYLEQVFLAFFLKYFLTIYSYEKFEEKMSSLYRDRLAFIQAELRS